MPSLDRNKEIKCNNCGKEVGKNHISRHKNQVRMVLFFVQNALDLLQTLRKIWILTQSKVCEKTLNFFTCGECGLDFHSFYAFRKRKQSLLKIKEQSSESDYIEIDFDTIMGDHANQEIWNELSSVKHFLIDSDSFRRKHKIFSFAITELNPQLISDKLRTVFSKLDNVAKLNISLGFVLRNIETGDYR